MIYGAYCRPQTSFGDLGTIYSDATVVLDFIGGVYQVNGLTVAPGDILSEVVPPDANGMYVGYNAGPPATETGPPFLIGAALAQAIATMQGQFTLLFEFQDTVGENSDSIAFGATQFSTGTSNTDDFWIAVGAITAFVYDQINEIPYIGNNREAGGTVVEGTVKRMVINRSPSLLLVYKDGSELARDSLATIDLSGIHTISIGGDPNPGAFLYDFSGYVRRVIFYPIKNESLLVALSSV